MTIGSSHNIGKSETLNNNIDNHQIDTITLNKLLGL